MTTYAKGLEGVIANESALSNVEGEEGRLSYLGYSIDSLVKNCSFEEVTFLLHRGHSGVRIAAADQASTTLVCDSGRSCPNAR